MGGERDPSSKRGDHPLSLIPGDCRDLLVHELRGFWCTCTGGGEAAAGTLQGSRSQSKVGAAIV